MLNIKHNVCCYSAAAPDGFQVMPLIAHFKEGTLVSLLGATLSPIYMLFNANIVFDNFVYRLENLLVGTAMGKEGRGDCSLSKV